MFKSGTRVGALQSIDKQKKEIRLYGYGVYQGEEIPRYFSKIANGIPNPKIKLDNGKIVWGYMSWWSEEEAMKRNIALLVTQGFKVINVDPPEDALPPSDESDYAQA